MLASEIHLIPDKTVLVQFLIFLSVLFGLSFLIFRPLKKIFIMRKERIEKMAEKAKNIEEGIKRFAEEYEKKMGVAREAAYKEKEKVRQAGALESQAIMAAARKDAAVLMDRARQNIEAAKGTALQELEKEVQGLVEDIIKKARDLPYDI